MEEQTATTNEMSRAVAVAPGNSTDIAARLRQVTDAATATSGEVGEAGRAAQDLSLAASELRELTGIFTH